MSLEGPSKLERIHEFLRKSLLGQELINTQFYLFSARSATSKSRRFTKPRALCANNVLLVESSKYFLDLLSSDVNPIDPSLSNLTDAHDVPDNIGIDAYGYASDSDLEDEDEDEDEAPPTPVKDLKKPKHRSMVRKTSHISVERQPKDHDELSQDDSESDGSDIFVMSPEHPRLDEPFPDGTGSLTPAMSSNTMVQETLDGDCKGSHGHDAAARLRFLGDRHILVKDTAFQTYYTLLNYLYTSEVSFLPLTSAVVAGEQPSRSSTSSLEGPRCSAKSMYRLACKVGLDDLREEAFAHIKNNLSENNILEELSCNLVSRHPELLEMVLDVLYSLLASPTVANGFPVLAQRIASKEVPHGADIIIGIHTRLLRGPLSWVKEPSTSPHSPNSESACISEPKSPTASPCLASVAGSPPSPSTVPATISTQPQKSAFGFGFGQSSSLFSSWGTPAGPEPGVAVTSLPGPALELASCEAQPADSCAAFGNNAEGEPSVESDVDSGFAASKKKKGGAGGGAKGKKKKKLPQTT